MTSTSFRLPESTMEQLRALATRLGMTLSQALVVAIDRMARDR
jgi:predicted DNA-binding protein